jgi:UDP-N-acetylglucosamine 4-epimerase
MTKYDEVQANLKEPRKWLVTGAAGFIGSHLVEKLLSLNQTVVGLDNFGTGHRRNLDEVKTLVRGEQWRRFEFIEGDICRLEDCRRACRDTDYVLHQAALGSVPRSIEDPLRSHATNVDGFLHMLIAARDAKVRRFIYASSSSVYGDHPGLPKREEIVGRPLSPYAVTKTTNEMYAEVFAQCYGMPTTGMRYFNVFGARQDPQGAYAAVIPKWFAALLHGHSVQINGDGETSRDFCYVANVVQANLLAAALERPVACAEIFNVAVGQATTLSELCRKIVEVLGSGNAGALAEPVFAPARAGDVRHSLADVSRARAVLGYEPTHTLEQGLREARHWYMRQAAGRPTTPA